MADRRRVRWKEDSFYTEGQIESVLNSLGIDIVGHSDNAFRVLCPFHGNTNGSAAAVNRSSGFFYCFNPGCGVHMPLVGLVAVNRRNIDTLITSAGADTEWAKSYIAKHYIEGHIHQDITAPAEFVEFDVNIINRLRDALWSPAGFRGREYLYGRKFNDQTLKYFDIGVSINKDMTTVPMHDPDGMPIGMIGRSIEGKRFYNSPGLPKKLTSWNFHRAKKYDTVIIVESSFDAMRLHQAGFPNAVALLGGSLSEYHVSQLDKTFESITIMTDFDHKQYYDACTKCEGDKCLGHRPGRELGWDIAERLGNKRIRWAAYDNLCVFPRESKDVGDLTDAEINQCLRNSVSHFEYVTWNIDQTCRRHELW